MDSKHILNLSVTGFQRGLEKGGSRPLPSSHGMEGMVLQEEVEETQ